MEIKDIILKPVLTEKSKKEAAGGRYTFIVAGLANKKEIKKAVEKLFGVSLMYVSTITIHGKTKLTKFRTRVKEKDFKKAIIWVTAGQKIEIFEAGEKK